MTKPNFHLFVGEDSFLVLEEAKRWKRVFAEKYGDNDLVEFNGLDASPEDIAEAVSSPAFLSERKLVIVKNFLSSRKTEVTQKIIKSVENIPDSTFLLMVETGEIDKRTVAFKELSAMATCKLFLKPKGAQLTNWVLKATGSYGGRMDAQTANYLVSWIGDDLYRLDNEVQKLSLYAGAQACAPSQGGAAAAAPITAPITIEMVDKLVANNIQQSIFTLTDNLARKDHASMLKTLKALQSQGEDAPFIFSMVVREFRIMIEIKALLNEGHSPAQIARDTKMHPFVVETAARHTKNFSFEKMRRALRELLELDERLKTGQIPLKPREEDQYLLAMERILLKL